VPLGAAEERRAEIIAGQRRECGESDQGTLELADVRLDRRRDVERTSPVQGRQESDVAM
jgi:hypothetical protein